MMYICMYIHTHVYIDTETYIDLLSKKLGTPQSTAKQAPKQPESAAGLAAGRLPTRTCDGSRKVPFGTR